MTPQEVRTSVFQFAVQGKLVEQRPEEGTGEELFQQIQTEKQALIKAGVFKKDKTLQEIAEDEIPFDIPDTWKWVRLDDVVTKSIKRGKSPTYTAKSGTLVFAQKCNTKAGYIDLDIALFLDESKLEKYPKEEFMQDKDIVINSTGNGTLGRVGVYRNTDNPRNLPIVPDSHVTVIRATQSVATEYVYYVLKYYQPYMEKLGTGSTNQTELSANVVRAMLFPLPPLTEQKRIVAKLEEILPLIDRYEAAWNKLEEFNKRFPGDMQKSILQLAIQGKLVEQRSEEGTGEELFQQIQEEKQALIKAGKIKKEKPLPEITEDEIPFDIPETWKWVRLRELGFFSSGKTPTMGEAKYWVGGTVPWITSKDMKKKYLDSSEMQITQEAAQEMRMYQPNTILMVVRSGILKRLLPVAILTGESTINQDIKAFSLHLPEIAEYVYYILKGMETLILNEYRKQVTTVDSLRFEEFQNMPVPIPPRAEQKRIIAKLEEILPLCDRLK